MHQTAAPGRGLDRSQRAAVVWGAILVVWLVVLCIVPDPRPLGAPEWSVKVMQSAVGLPEPASRAMATIVLRACGLGLIGILVSLCLAEFPFRRTVIIVLLASPLLAIACQWANYGYFPIWPQIQLAVASSVTGGLTGLALRRSWSALLAPALFVGGVFLWGTSTGISDDLYEVARATGDHVLANAEAVPDGDDGFKVLLQSAFAFAEDNSHRSDAILPNQAAILALGVILGEEKVAAVAGRSIDISRKGEWEALRNRITLRGRNDLARHFWVSAALAVLSDESRSMTVGIGKELMDATPGGSGFSFVDLTADRAGTLLTVAATQSAESARTTQLRIRRGIAIADFCPDIEGLPEGLSRDEFQGLYGGLGGERTEEIVQEIQSRLANCPGLNVSN